MLVTKPIVEETIPELVIKAKEDSRKRRKMTAKQRLEALIAKKTIKMNKDLAIAKLDQHGIGIVSPVHFITTLPKGCRIESMQYRATYDSGKRRLSLPEYLKKDGVVSVSETLSHIAIRGNFKDFPTNKHMIEVLGQISRTYKVPIARIFIVKVVVSDDSKKNSIVLKRKLKKIESGMDLRKGKLILALDSRNGTNADQIMKKLQLTKYYCTFATVQTRIQVCREEKVV